MEEEHAEDRTVWSGWDVRGGVEADEARAAFVGGPRPGNEERYELLAVAARGFRPPTFLTRTGAGDAGDGPGTGDGDLRSSNLLRQVWSLVYRPVPPVPPRPEPPFAVYLLGVNPPPDATEEDRRAFEEFYVGVHVPEVAERRQALRAVPHALVDVAKAPYRGAPAFLTAYEMDERAAAVRRHVGPPYRAGPEVWQRHTTPWRLWYRRIGTDGPAS
jgi:hypothetical protein